MEMGLTAKELAQRASVTPGYISQIEHDQIKPSMNVMMRIAEVLNVPMAALLMAEQAPEEIVVTPRSARTKIKFADVNTEYEFLTPFRRTHDRGNQIEVIHYSLSPRTWGSATAMLHPGGRRVLGGAAGRAGISHGDGRLPAGGGRLYLPPREHAAPAV